MIFSAKSLRSFLTLAATACAAQLVFLATPALALKDYMPDKLNVGLLRQNDPSGEAVLHLSTAVNLSGCPRVNPLRHDVQINDIYLDIVIKGYTIDFRDMPQAPQYACKQDAQYATADIPIDRTLIESNKIQKIRLRLDHGRGSDDYAVILNTNTMELIPQTQTIFKPMRAPRGGQLALTHWYYPENTIILSAPSTPRGVRNAAVIEFARQSGLTDLAGLFPDFTPPGRQNDLHYYVDQAGTLADKIPARDRVNLNNTIQARRPGSYE